MPVNNPLLLKVYKAYLNPLLQKHEKGQTIVYEDLQTSWKAVQTLLKQQQKQQQATNATTAVKIEISKLHQTQLKAYETAARQALTEYARNLPTGQPLQTAVEQAPAWKLTRAQLTSLIQKEQTKATANDKQQKEEETAEKETMVTIQEQEQEDETAEDNNDDNNDKKQPPEAPADKDDEEGQVPETTTATTTTATTTTTKKKIPPKRKAAGKPPAKKKVEKAGRTLRRTARRGRGALSGNVE